MFALISNGVCMLLKVNAKSTAVMNVIAGSALLIVNLAFVASMEPTAANYLNVTAGLLFSFNYFFIASCLLFNVEWRAYGLYAMGVVMFASVMLGISMYNKDWLFAALWGAWGLLWLESFVEHTVGVKQLGKAFPFMAIAVGIFAAGLPGILMLTGVV